MSAKTKKTKAPARTGDAGRARAKFDGISGLIPHALVAEKFGVSPDLLRAWVHKGEFPRPHCVVERTWLYRVDPIRAFLETGKWPEGVEFRRPATRQDDEG